MKTKGKIMKLGIILGCIILTIALLIGVLPFGIQNVSAAVAESYHPYANNEDETWTISEPGVDQIRIHFSRLELPRGARDDKVIIMDKDDNELVTYTPQWDNVDLILENTWTEWFTEDTLKIRLRTDGERTAFGFIVDKVETRTEPAPTSSYLAESDHPYANNYDHTWTISEPGVEQIRIHFSRLELPRGARDDKVIIMDKDDNELVTYTPQWDNVDLILENTWTEWFTEDTLKIRLRTDGSGTAFGFLVDQIETRGTSAEPTPTTQTPTPTSTSTSTPTLTPTSTPIQIPTPVASPITYEYPTPALKAGEPYVHLYGHKTNVIVGEEVILYLSAVNPITSPGTLKVQLTLQVPSGWSITSGEFSPPVGGFQTAVYDIEQGPDSKTIGIHMLANQPFDGVITGYTDYYFIEEPESKYHGEIKEPVIAKKKLLPSPTPRPAETPAPKPPGFEAILALAGILAVAYLLRQKK